MIRSNSSARDVTSGTGVKLVILDYLWRYKWLTLPVLALLLVCRFLSGRNIVQGGRSTDATFFRPAREVRGSWYANQRGAVRLALRLVAFGLLLLYAAAPTAVYVLLAAGAVWAVWAALRRYRARAHYRAMVDPIWPAIAGIIGVPASQPGSRWVDIPAPAPQSDDADLTGRQRLARWLRGQPSSAGVLVPRGDEPILVGLRSADAADDRRVVELVRLFDQRYGRNHVGRVDYTSRLVLIAPRPAEEAYWPDVARILDVDPDELADRWLRVEHPPGDSAATGPRVTVAVPYGTPLDKARDALKGLLYDVYGHPTWDHTTWRDRRELALYPHPPAPTPPVRVSLTDTPDYEWSQP